MIARLAAAIFFILTLVPARLAGVQEKSAPPKPTANYDSDGFIKELSRLKADLDTARKSTDGLHTYRESLPDAWSVDTGGHHYDVPTDLLASQIEKAEKQPEFRRQEMEHAQAYLDALAAETASLSGRAPLQTDSARSKLNAILARPEYNHTRPQSAWQKLKERISDALWNAVERILRHIGGGASLGRILLWMAVCGAALFIAYFIFRQWFRAARTQEMALQAASAPSRSWQEWIFAARGAASHGDYRMAVHCAYWAGIARLQDLGSLAPDRAKTPREYLRALTKSKLILPETLEMRHQALSLLTARLEKIWYGYQIATEADFHDSIAQLETLGCHLP